LSTLRIIVLTLLTLFSISPLVMASGPHKPVLTTQLFSQPVQFSRAWNITNTCGGIIPLFNFTVTLSGKDPGSLWIDFRPFPLTFQGSTHPQNVANVYNSTNFPDFCGNDANVISASVFFGNGGDSYWHVLQSGNYSALTGFSNPPPTAIESWTVTTIS
jgi:hypothetical protein